MSWLDSAIYLWEKSNGVIFLIFLIFEAAIQTQKSRLNKLRRLLTYILNYLLVYLRSCNCTEARSS